MNETIQNLEAERVVLGAVLTYGREPMAEAAQHLEARHFGEKRHALIFDAALRIFERGDAVDVVTVRAELGDVVDMTSLAALTVGLPRITNMGDWVELVLDRARRRAAYNLGRRLMEQAQDETVLTQDLLDRHAASLAQLVEVASSGNMLSMRDVVKQAAALIDRFVESD